MDTWFLISKVKPFLIILLAILIIGNLNAAPKKTNIVVFTPTSENNTYWPQVYLILHAVAEDLYIDLDTYEFEVTDRYAKQREGVQILKAKPGTDGAIFSVAFGQTLPLIKTAEQMEIPSFIQGPLFASELEQLGYSPREKYKNWIGYFLQNEKQKGYLLGNTLIKAAAKKSMYAADGKIHLVGIGGDPTWFGSEMREEGLIKAVQELEDVQLKQIVSTQWSPSEGKKMMDRLLRRYPEVSVVWAASDQLAIGAIEAIRNAGKEPGRDILVGGLDLSKNGLQHVKKGEMEATVSGSMLSYAKILILLYDYIHGYDFARDVGLTVDSRIYTATQEKADFFLSFFGDVEHINFRSFSKTYTTELDTYDFSLERFHNEQQE